MLFKKKDIDYLFNLAERTRNETEKANALAKEVYQNATNILETLEKFDELISAGKEKVKQSESLKPIIEENIQNSKKLMNEVNSQLDNLNLKLNEIKSISTKSVNVLAEANAVSWQNLVFILILNRELIRFFCFDK